VFAQYNKTVMYSNQKIITLFIGEGKNDWTITPSPKPDIFRMYSANEKSKKFRFVSDVDSIEFIAEINKPVHFSIIYNGDTAYTAVEFIDYIPSTLTDADKLHALSLFWSEAKYNFAFIDKLTFNLDSLYKAYIPKVLATANDYEFYDAMQLFAGCFKDAHTNVYYNEFGSYTDYISVTARYFGDELYLVNAREDIEKQFPVGSKILEINNMPVAEYMEKYVEPYIESDFEPTLKVLSASKLFASNLYSHVITVKYQTPENKIKVYTLPRDGNAKSGKSVGYQHKYSEKSIEIQWEKENIAVLKFNTFYDYNGQLIPYFEQLKDTLYTASGIIVDLRQNRGGGTNIAWHLLQYIIKEPYFLNFAWQTRVNDGVKKANGNWITEYEDFYKNAAYSTVPADTIFIPDSIKRFDAPIIVLFSTMTVSAAEDFLIILNEHPNRPLFIGQPSFGSTGSPLVLPEFLDNGIARICTRRVLFPYSLKPFTEGIQPDIHVTYTFDEFMSGRDKYLEVAVEELEKQIKKDVQ
jgi:C-terminal processing protease CtpA/Prc